MKDRYGNNIDRRLYIWKERDASFRFRLKPIHKYFLAVAKMSVFHTKYTFFLYLLLLYLLSTYSNI